jgi:hypothetical protein
MRRISMRRTGKLVIFLALFVALSSIVVLTVVADDGAPLGITDTPTPTATDGPITPVIPEASTLVLLGGSLTGLATYIGLQIRARRRRP